MPELPISAGLPKGMPQYRCHKTVAALRITGIRESAGDAEGLVYLDVEPAVHGPVLTSLDWLDEKNVAVGGYLVSYEDGYRSYSPAAAFEAGYTLIPS